MQNIIYIKTETVGRPTIESLEQAKHIRQIMDDKKAQDIVIIDVRKESTITDFYVIASGMSSPHLKAVSGDLTHQLKQEGVYCYRSSGEASGGWVIVDYVDVIIHIFSPEAREYYDIESLWDQAPRID